MECLTSFGNFVAKNRAFDNNIIFLQQFFLISWEFAVSPVGYATVMDQFLKTGPEHDLLFKIIP